MSEPTKNRSFISKLFRSDFNVDFVGKRNRWFALSGILLVISIGAMVFSGLNLGVEFTGGSVFSVKVSAAEADPEKFTTAVQATDLPDLEYVQTTVIGSDTMRVQTRSLETDEVPIVRTAIAEVAGVPEADIGFQLIGPSWGKQITQKGLQALAIFLVLVTILIGTYFRNWKMSIAALIALFHNLVVTVGIYSLVGFSFSPATLIGVLTVLGYSLYDTVVVFDMIREDTQDITSQNRTYSEAANSALNRVLVRSINTTIVAVLPVLAVLIAGITVLGGQGALADLGLVMFIGMLVGPYASIFLATPLLTMMKEREPELAKHRKAVEKRRAKSTPKVAVELVVTGADAPSIVTPVSVESTPSSAESVSSKRTQPKKSSRSGRK